MAAVGGRPDPEEITMTLRSLCGLLLISWLTVAGCDAAKSKSGGSNSGGTAAGGSSAKGSTNGAAAAPPAAPAQPEITLTPMKITAIKDLMATKKGKVIVVDTWSTYCEPCMKEFPGLVALHKKYGPDKVACISLCVNFQGIGKPTDPDVFDEPLAFLKTQGATFDNVLSADSDSDLYSQWKFNSVPAVFVFDRDGKELKRFVDKVNYTEIDALVAPLVK
jgi:thiol-disulfide isomerase/thioredoxin